MIGLTPDRVGTILLLGAHCDDIEIGCGATVLHLVKQYPKARYYWVVLASNPVRAAEARRSAALFLSDAVEPVVRIESFRNGYFPYVGADIKDFFEAVKKDVAPDLIFTHAGNDLHQDHRVTSELTWNTFRDHFILEYEIPKYDGGLGSPNLFVPADDQRTQLKIDYLHQCFASEANKQWFTPETFLGLMRLRGIECASTTGFAEAFYCRKAVMEL
ncbi:MAG: PIG-L family deacetylase [Methylotetracoccus sp.]